MLLIVLLFYQCFLPVLNDSSYFFSLFYSSCILFIIESNCMFLMHMSRMMQRIPELLIKTYPINQNLINQSHLKWRHMTLSSSLYTNYSIQVWLNACYVSHVFLFLFFEQLFFIIIWNFWVFFFQFCNKKSCPEPQESL